MRHRFPLLMPALLALLLLAAPGCGGEGDVAASVGAEAAATPPVEVVEAKRGALPLRERLSGSVRADNQVSVRAEIEAPILEVFVRSGESVEQGQPLVRLLDDALRERLRQAEANLRLAEASAAESRARRDELKARVVRSRNLAEQELISALELETLEAQLAGAEAAAAQAVARVEQARASVEERRSALSKTIVRAPVSGRVGRRAAEVGMIVGPGTPLFTLGNLDDLIVEIPLTEEMLAFIEEGQRVRISSPALGGDPLVARLSRISPFLAPGTFSTTGEIDVDNPEGRLRPGMFVTVDVLYGESSEATLVPASALWEDPGTRRQGVYVVDMKAAGETVVPAASTLERPSERSPARAPREEAPEAGDVPGVLDPTPRPARFRPVTLIAEGRERVAIEGIEPGEWVVVIGHHLLRAEGEQLVRTRVTSWDRVIALQALQREDLLAGFLARQQRWATERGAEPPSNEEFLRGDFGRESDKIDEREAKPARASAAEASQASVEAHAAPSPTAMPAELADASEDASAGPAHRMTPADASAQPAGAL